MAHFEKRDYEPGSPRSKRVTSRPEVYERTKRNSREMGRFYRDVTADAPARGEQWSEAEDDELLHGDGTVAEIALRLGRTYSGATARLRNLRAMIENGETVRYDSSGRTVVHPEQVLCPCGTLDDDHSTWCPMHPDNAPLYEGDEQ